MVVVRKGRWAKEIATAAQVRREAWYKRGSEIIMLLLDITCGGHQDEGYLLRNPKGASAELAGLERLERLDYSRQKRRGQMSKAG